MMHYSIQSVGIRLDIPNLRSLPKRRHSRAIIQSVAKAFMVSPDDLMGHSRFRMIAWPRQAAYLLLRRERGLSFGQIAQIFDRDHSTIVHGCRAAEERLDTDQEFAACYWRAAR